MKSDLLKSVVDNLLTKLYSFAHALIPDELQAEQLIIDSYSIFLMKHKSTLSQMDTKRNKLDSRLKISIRNYVLKYMLQEIYELGVKRISQLNISTNSRFNTFNSLLPQQKAVVHLQEVLEFKPNEISRILNITHHEVLEHFYNAQSILMTSKVSPRPQEVNDGP